MVESLCHTILLRREDREEREIQALRLQHSVRVYVVYCKARVGGLISRIGMPKASQVIMIVPATLSVSCSVRSWGGDISVFVLCFFVLWRQSPIFRGETC
ncbi:unnamed protein product [Ectocarpus fasciculatus]